MKPCLEGRKILLGITGSIAAFKSCDIIRFLKECKAEVRVILTEGGEKFVTETTLETLSDSPVLKSLWQKSSENEKQIGNHHIHSARWADLILIAPSTAHTIGKLACGLADDLLTTEVLAFRGPVLIAPAMNPTMYSNPAVQENIQKLISRGMTFLGPTKGLTSCGEEGLGRMLEPIQIVEKVASHFYSRKKNKKILITLGPTRSSIDPVRFITNRSSGLMGAALCWAGIENGYDVTAVCGPIDVPLPDEITVYKVQTASEMAEIVTRIWDSHHIFIAAAAVLDWDVEKTAHHKLKKEDGMPLLHFRQNVDILAFASSQKRKDQFVLGFAAETQDPLFNAQKKLKNKNCDALFANDVSQSFQGFESSFNGGWWLTPHQTVTLETAHKAELARKLIHLIEIQTHSPEPLILSKDT